MCINPLPITNLLTNVLRAPGSASAMTSMRPSTLKAHEVALRNKKGREVLMMDLKVQSCTVYISTYHPRRACTVQRFPHRGLRMTSKCESMKRPCQALNKALPQHLQ